MREKMKKICGEFGLTVGAVERRLGELGSDGLLIEGKTMQLRPIPHAYVKDPPLHLNRFYFALASLALKNVRNILEIGTGAAESTIVLSKLFPKATVFTIDLPKGDPDYVRKSQNQPGTSRGTLCKHNLERGKNIRYIQMNSFFLPSLNFVHQFELILVDAAHWYPPVAADLSFAYCCTAHKGWLFMHDYITPEKKHPTWIVGKAVNWMAQRIPERLFLFPQLTPPKKIHIKMALVVKGRMK